MRHPSGALFVTGYWDTIPRVWASGDNGATRTKLDVGAARDKDRVGILIPVGLFAGVDRRLNRVAATVERHVGGAGNDLVDRRAEGRRARPLRRDRRRRHELHYFMT